MINTIIYLTDNSLSPEIAGLCQRVLVREAGGLPIISVSQRPVDLGRNICLGEIGRSWISLYRQLLAGCAAAETEWVAVCEHDCLYTHEHLSYRPVGGGVFHYNTNCWLVQWGGNHPELNGMYSYWPRRLVLSQLICRRDLLRESITERLAILEGGASWDREFLGYGEPGVVSARALDKARRYAASGQNAQLAPYLAEYLTKYAHGVFQTDAPNLDIRHSSNFTGPKRGKKRCYHLPYWGRFEEVIHND
jgi:hypothetical protein